MQYGLSILNPIPDAYRCFSELDLNVINKNSHTYSVYVIDYDWTYRFVNDFATKNLGNVSIVGKNIQAVWEAFPHINFKPVYELLKDSVDRKKVIQVKLHSPISKKAIEIKGYPLSDCYYFIISELPDKEALINELRTCLKKGH